VIPEIAAPLLQLAVPVMLACVVIGLAMRAWVWSTIRKAAEDPQWGALYSRLNPDGFVILFELKLLRALALSSESSVSRADRAWLRFYVASRFAGLLASMVIGFVLLSSP
jgi:hypothetical protein